MDGTGVGCPVAEVERGHFCVGDSAGVWVTAGVVEALGAVREPVGFGHAVNKDGFGFGGGLVFGGERLF